MITIPNSATPHYNLNIIIIISQFNKYANQSGSFGNFQSLWALNVYFPIKCHVLYSTVYIILMYSIKQRTDLSIQHKHLKKPENISVTLNFFSH